MFFGLLRCVGRALVKRGLEALSNLLPLGDLLYEMASDALDEWKRCRRDDERRAEVEALARASAEEVRAQVQAAAEEAAGDQPPEVRQAVAAYLAQLPATVRRSLRRPADPTGTTVPPALALDTPRDLAALLPTRLPRFRAGDRPIPGVPWALLELLGVGGFGEVWKAHNPRFPGLTVALKFCLDRAARDRLLHHEAALIERVLRHGRHPGIVELRQAYLDVDPPCLEYEHVPGGDLVGLIQDWQRGGGLPATAIQQVMQRLAEAVAFAHSFDPPIVHRDLKPANVLVRRGSGGFRMKIADFGIGGLAMSALQADSRGLSGHGPRLTSLVRGAYTPLYASPEQMRGEPPDPRDDVHALGVIWYQMLTGDLTAGAPSGRLWPRRLRERGLSEAAIDLLSACVEPHAADRPADAGVVAEQLAGNAPPEPAPTAAARTGPPAEDLAAIVRRTLDHVADTHARARQLVESAQDYGEAARLLDELPEHLRDAPLYQGVCARRERVALLDQEIRQAVAGARLHNLWPVVTALLKLQPRRDDLRSLLEQLPHPPELKQEITNPLGMRLRLLPAGSFVMGSPPAEMERQANEGPLHPVELTQPFYIGVYPVTQREYEAVTGRNPARFHPGNGGSPEHPVEQVSWEDAVAFCLRLSEITEVTRWGRVYRLPTEAEWEYACRAGMTTVFLYGDSLSSRQANFNGYYPYGRAGVNGPYLERTSRVGAYAANAWGLHDLHGNVWEWCQDWFDDNYYRHSPERDPQGPAEGERRVLRGGAWYYYGWFCRAAYRYRRRPDERLDSAGFRVVLALPA